MTLAARLAANASLLAMLMQRAGGKGIKASDLSGLLDDLVSAAAEAGDVEMQINTLQRRDLSLANQRFRRTNDEGPSALPTPTSPLTVEPLWKAQNSYAVHPTPAVGRPANWTRPSKNAPTTKAGGVAA